MASFVQSKTNALSSYLNSFTIAPTGAFTAGNAAIITISGGKTSGSGMVTSITDTSSNTWVRLIEIGSGAYYSDTWICKNLAGSTPTITVNLDNYYAATAVMQEWSGLGTSTSIDASITQFDSGYVNTRSIGATSPSTTVTNTVAFVVYAGNHAANTYTTPSGYSNAATANGGSGAFDSSFMASKALASSGVTETVTLATGQFVQGAGAIIILNTTASSGGSFGANKTQTATARISKALTLTQGAVSRITKSLTKTQSSTSRIQATVTKTQGATGRISKTVTKTQTATANIFVPKQGWRDNLTTLPTTNSTLTTALTGAELANVAADDSVFVAETGSNTYNVFLFKKNNGSVAPFNIVWNGKSDIASSTKPITLQVYNISTSGWETLQTDSTTAANTEFTLTGAIISNYANYYDGSGYVWGRVYQ